MSQINSADTGYMADATLQVFLMTPGLALFYAGMIRYRLAQTTLVTCVIAIALVTVQWFVWGYTLVYSESGSAVIGDLRHAFFRGVGSDPNPLAPTIPELQFAFYQLMFAIITPAIAYGAAAERLYPETFMAFVFIWSTLVYDPVACWTWGPNGWLKNDIQALDFAGGGPVHMTSGFTALACAMVFGNRANWDEHNDHTSIVHVTLGTAFLWYGWFGFNGGSELAINERTVNACVVSMIAACTGGISWLLMDYITTTRLPRKLSGVDFCCGVVAGLVVITPGAGFVAPGPSVLFGVLAGVLCFSARNILKARNFDDALDVVSVHGVGGTLGSILTGFFAQKSIAELAGGTASIEGGWMDRNWIQPARQLVAVTVIALWSFGCSYVLMRALKYVMQWIKVTFRDHEHVPLGDGSEDGRHTINL